MSKEKPTDFFRREDVMVLLTTSPAGLGHTRVTEALISGLPKGIRAEILGIEDMGIQFFHRLSSKSRYWRYLTELFQNNPYFEGLFTSNYIKSLRKDTIEEFNVISDLVKRRRPSPQVLLIISTHFSLAHKIAEIKTLLSRELKTCVILCVVVTDDSPQKVWGVYGADYIFVPSAETKRGLITYFNSLNINLPEIVVSAYPISPKFSVKLSREEFKNRQFQVNPKSLEKLRVIIPISGAAVQLDYFKKILTYIDEKKKAEITVVSRDSKYTKEFIKWCQAIQSIEVVADKFDKEVVKSYEEEIENNIFSIEITKPSEQSFKALLTPQKRGGVILLFSEPVGRQEYDNLKFLSRHGLIPNTKDQTVLNQLFTSNKFKMLDKGLLERAKGWRGLMLPKDGKLAGRAILRLKKVHVLAAMVDFKGFEKNKELKSNGVKLFWRKLAKHSKTQCSFLDYDKIKRE